MGRLSALLDKIPIIGRFTQRNTTELNNVDIQFNKAMDLIEHGVSFEAITTLESVADIGTMNPEYKNQGCDALKILTELFELGKFGNAKVKVDVPRACKYLERYYTLSEESDVCFKLAEMYLDTQNFSRALTYLEKAAAAGINAAFLRLGEVYENGLNRVDEYGNKSDYIIPIDLEKAKMWYQKLADKGDQKAQIALERVEYKDSHVDSLQFEEKDRLYTQIAEKRKAKGIEPRFRVIEASKQQYQYTYVHDEVEGFIHKLPKDWVKSINTETDEEYYAPSRTYKDFAIYVNYDSKAKESKRDLEMYMRYQNEAFDIDMTIQEYVTEYADGICATFYHKELEKGIVTFAYEQQNRLACIRCVCATMDIIEQYEEIIFEVGNSFAFVNPTLLSEQSANRKENQYYSEAVFHYYMGDYELAMEFAKRALSNGSLKASYLLIELYFDEDSPYRDIQRAVNYAQELFNANKDPDLAFLIGNIYDQHLKDYTNAKQWYEEADRLHHKRVPFYLGRLYYYGVLPGKRDGRIALDYFKRAKENGIFEADAYIKDIEALGTADLQKSVESWEAAVEAGDAQVALDVAIKKRDQVFFIANEKNIEHSFRVALQLGAMQAAYELGKICRQQEKKPEYTGEKLSIQYFEKAFDGGFTDFEKEFLYEVITYKEGKGLDKSSLLKMYLVVAEKGYAPAIEKLIALSPTLTLQIRHLYDALKEKAQTGDEVSLSAMYKLEMAYNDLVLQNVGEDEKAIENKFFRLTVPKSCTAQIDDEGGTIKMADSIAEFAVAEMPVNTTSEEDYLKVYKLILSEYMQDENAEIVIANSRMIGSAILTAKGRNLSYSILLISSKNQYLFKLTSTDKRELLEFKDVVLKIAKSLVETGEIYVADENSAKKKVGLTFLMSAGENGMLSIAKDD